MSSARQVARAASRRITKGDFSVNLTADSRIDSPCSDLGESINTMAAQLNQLETMRQEFVSNVSHDIQSPLTSIGGFAKALQSEELEPEERRHYLGIIEL